MVKKNMINFELSKDFKFIMKNVRNDNLKETIDEIVELLKKYKKIILLYSDFLLFDFIINIKIEDYILGSCGDNFEGVCRNIVKQKSEYTVSEIWQLIHGLIWDLVTPTTVEVCPQCESDHIRILTNQGNNEIYRYCRTCYYISGEICIDDLLPATRYQILALNIEISDSNIVEL